MNGPTRVNGTKRPDVPILGAVTPIRIGGMPAAEPEPVTVAAAPARTDLVSEAEAEAIRTRAAAEADAIRAKAEQDAEQKRLANLRTARRMEVEDAERATKLAELNKRRTAIERETADLLKAADEATEAEAKTDEARAKTRDRWKACALGFAIACGVVALPVQMSAFYDPGALWLLAAPFMLEGGAWVVLQGAAAAVNDGRPHWHYRLIAWLLAFVAAGINLSHGLAHFGKATAFGTAFASLAGPGVWDLHEHGRIRLRDGKLTRRERRAKRAEDRRIAAQRKAEQDRIEAAQKADADAAEKAASQLAAEREKTYPKEWERALALRAALGETTVTEAVWKRAWYDVHGTDPGDTVDTIRTRRTAERRIEMARAETPTTGGRKAALLQRPAQMPPTASKGSTTLRHKPIPPRRRKGDTAPYHPVAKAAAAETARRTAVTATVSDTSRKDA